MRRLRDIWRRFQGRGTYPHQLAFLLTIPVRRYILSPETLIERLHLEGASRVLEVGPGPGYFSAHVARSIPTGWLYLFDIQREMLVKARARVQRANVCNVSFTQGDATALPFKPATFDAAFFVAVLGEVPDPPACIASVRHSLRLGGLLSVTEMPGDPDALSRTEVKTIAGPRGFEFLELLPVRGGFTANFRACRIP